ncbi:uncharacterized protein [Paralichthys olivaceus]|uniref:uncharacterized protein isoform X2 n=1 Tax=Paralichthys olivaceus TaxID=8255 RepID=UPI00097D9C7C|nr:PREDICTED: uncharacterized protein LOC109627383 [Paralichthys olivaceus]
MDFKTAVTISALLLITAEATEHEPDSTSLPRGNFSDEVNQSSPAAPSTTAAPSNPSRVTPFLGFLTVNWTNKCAGHLFLHNLFTPSTLSTPSTRSTSHRVCHDSEATVRELLTTVCENKKGCTDKLQLVKGGDVMEGYNISVRGVQLMTSCETLTINCKVYPAEDKPDVKGQLQSYRVATALLCCVLLVLLLIRFTRPTVQALQKRLSDRRQNRWVGPTQSHSVSYQRGKTCKNDDGENRLSFPALDRLTVSDSREPSSNRNSDYNY